MTNVNEIIVRLNILPKPLDSSNSLLVPKIHARHSDYMVESYDIEASIPKATTSIEEEQKRLVYLTIYQKTFSEAVRGGLSGAVGGVVQVITMMWLRTTVNYQCRYGVGIFEALRILYNEGGISRFYQGIVFALIQGPLSRFGTIAANEGSREFVRLTVSRGDQQKLVIATALGSVLASLWRIFLMPIDTCKTVLQVEGSKGFQLLVNRVVHGDIQSLYQGTGATVLSSIVGHYPWFMIHNWLDNWLPKPKDRKLFIFRNAMIGFASSAVSDTVSNVIRVVKTVKQASISGTLSSQSYIEIIAQIYADGGLAALFGRGLLLRIISNGIQSMLFTVVWKLVSSRIHNQRIEQDMIHRNL